MIQVDIDFVDSTHIDDAYNNKSIQLYYATQNMLLCNAGFIHVNKIIKF